MAQPTFVDYYKTLGITPTADQNLIRSTYLSLAKREHPDKGGNVSAMRLLNQAYATLRSPTIRREYDKRYRRFVLGQKTTDMDFSNSDVWDLDEVDEFLHEVYHQDRRRQWLNPMVVSFTAVGLGLLVFVIVSVARTMVSANTSPRVTSASLQRSR